MNAQDEQIIPRYFNRELSWIRFNRRVLDEALNPSNPLLERLRFLSIFSNNLDEFFMIRVSGLIRQLEEGVHQNGEILSPAEQLAEIRRQITPDIKKQLLCLHRELLPALKEEGIKILSLAELKDKERKYFNEYFNDEIFPVLTPLAFDPGHPFPHISNLSLNLALVLQDDSGEEFFARLKIPEVFPRFLPAPYEDGPVKKKVMGLPKPHREFIFIRIEDLIRANLDRLFPGLKVVDAVLFRVTRDADIEIEEDEAEDLLKSISEGVDRRRFGSVVRLQIEKGTSKRIRDILTRNLGLAPFQVYPTGDPIGLSSFSQIANIQRPDLSYPAFSGGIPKRLEYPEGIFDAIKKQDILLYHPYDSYRPVVDFIRLAAKDPDVIAIKQTLYRTGRDSPIIHALMNACQMGKQVAVLVELKARFDEENNIGWAKALESAGVHVVYGLMGLKTHAKICMVVRREKSGICRYIHMGTGNYNPITARVYSDFGLFTCNPEIAADAVDLFNFLTGYSKQTEYRRLLVAPGNLRKGILSRIDREIAHHLKNGDGKIFFKLNALSDEECIDALYCASQNGVQIELQVRGICCLRPQVPGLSDNIRVTSIVGRFLEHPRVFYFHNGGEEDLFLGSADLMTRNLDRRVETLFPIESADLKKRIMYGIIAVHLRDNVNASYLNALGEYVRQVPQEGEEEMDSQQWMLDNGWIWHSKEDAENGDK